MLGYRERWFLVEAHDVKRVWVGTNGLSQLNPAIFDFGSFGLCSQKHDRFLPRFCNREG